MATRVFVQDRPRVSAERRLRVTSIARPAGDAPRRALNIGVAALGIALTLPVMLVIAVLVKLTSRGPVFFTQPRVGVDRRAVLAMGDNRRRHRNVGGRIFTIYKFRTMRVGSGNGQVWARPDDSRITSVGRVLRRLRLDELPQLFNVLRGDMNVVGPRPEQPEIVVHLREQVPHYPQRQRVLPGITGWAQINQCYDRSLEDVRRKVDLDLEYIQRRSPLEDLRIMVRTVPVMLGRRGAW